MRPMSKFAGQTVVFLLCLLCLPVVATAQNGEATETHQPNPYQDLPWKRGPASGPIASHAIIQVPEGYMFLEQASVGRFMEMGQNIPNEDECGVLAPNSDNETWVAVFEYEEIGYVQEDEGKSLDAGKILESFRKGTAAGNEERAKRGWGTMEIIGWSTPPHYEPQGHHLEWGILGRSHRADGTSHEVTNLFVKMLGRNGVMTCQIIGSPQEMQSAATQVRQLLNGFTFNTGRRYEEYIKGDKVAAVGLTGLIVGGAAVAAAKSGLLAKLFKPLLVALFAFGAALLRGIGGFFNKLTGRGNDGQTQ